MNDQRHNARDYCKLSLTGIQRGSSRSCMSVTNSKSTFVEMLHPLTVRCIWQPKTLEPTRKARGTATCHIQTPKQTPKHMTFVLTEHEQTLLSYCVDLHQCQAGLALRVRRPEEARRSGRRARLYRSCGEIDNDSKRKEREKTKKYCRRHEAERDDNVPGEGKAR